MQISPSVVQEGLVLEILIHDLTYLQRYPSELSESDPGHGNRVVPNTSDSKHQSSGNPLETDPILLESSCNRLFLLQ